MRESVNLTHEVEVLHRQLFRFDAPQRLTEHYIRCHTEVPELMQCKDSERRTVKLIIDKDLNALGIEPWLRIGLSRHLLTRKLLLIAYIAECDAEHPEFREEARGHIRSLVKVFNSSTLALFHLLWGLIQKNIYGLL